jgi:hypothetical protein
MTNFSDTIRAAAGHAPALVPDEERPVGNIGLGQGGAARPAPPARATSMDVSARIRHAVRLQRSFSLPNGVRLDDVGELDDFLGI